MPRPTAHERAELLERQLAKGFHSRPFRVTYIGNGWYQVRKINHNIPGLQLQRIHRNAITKWGHELERRLEVEALCAQLQKHLRENVDDLYRVTYIGYNTIEIRRRSYRRVVNMAEAKRMLTSFENLELMSRDETQAVIYLA